MHGFLGTASCQLLTLGNRTPLPLGRRPSGNAYKWLRDACALACRSHGFASAPLALLSAQAVLARPQRPTVVVERASKGSRIAHDGLGTRRHRRSTFNLSTCRCASFCTWATVPVHGSIGWACFLGRQPFVGELTLKSVRQPRMRHHGKAAQPMVRRGHGLPAGGPGAPRALP